MYKENVIIWIMGNLMVFSKNLKVVGILNKIVIFKNWKLVLVSLMKKC